VFEVCERLLQNLKNEKVHDPKPGSKEITERKRK
jgi:hypothetical protein